MGSSRCFGVQNTLSQPSSSVESSTNGSPGRAAEGANEGVNSVSYFQGCHFSGGSLPGAVHFNSISSGEGAGDRGVPPGDQLESTEQIPSQGDVQDGGAPHRSLSSPQGRFHDETRPQGRLLCSPDSPRIEEISSVPIRGNNIRVLLSPIWPLSGSPSLHQNPPSYRSETALRGNTNSHLLGRSPPDSPSEGQIDRDLQLCAEASVQPGIHSETREMLSRTNSSLSLSGCSVGHNFHVYCPAGRASHPDTASMPGDARVPVDISGGPVKPTGPHEPCCTDRSVGGTVTLQSPTTPAGSATPPVRMATQVSDKFVSTSPGGPEMVGVIESTLSQQSEHHSAPLRPYHQDRCILAGLGSDLQWQDNRGTLECGGGRTTHQLPRAQGSHPSLEVIPRRGHAVTTAESSPLSSATYPSGDGQYYCGRICEQEGGHSIPFSVPTGLGTVVLPVDKGSVGNSPSLTRSVECGGRHSLTGIQHTNRVDAAERSFPGHNSSLLCSRGRPLCVTFKSSAASLRVAATRPRCYSSGCLSTRLESVDKFHSPSSGSSASNPSESAERQSNGSSSSPELAGSAMVRSDSADADRHTVPTSQGEVSPVAAFRPGGSSPSVAEPQPDCMADIGSSYQAAGFPEEVTNILLASWSQSTKKRYQGPWRAWSHWCSSKGLCPFSAPVTDVLTFLAELVTSRSLEYRTLAVYKSAISQGHLPVGQTRLGDLPVVSRFMKGIFRMKPPTPRLSSTWTVRGLLEFLATLDPPSDLTLKMLSLKLAALLALTSSARAHELIKLDLDFALIKSDSWEFTLAEHTKVSRPGHPTRKIYLPAYPVNPKICVVRALQEYRSRTETRRQSSRLLISFVRPFKPISSQTVSRWLRKAMQLAGIACHFTGHSTRSASTSAAAQAGVPLESILMAADWSSSETFKRFYLRSPDKGEFARAVLAALPE